MTRHQDLEAVLGQPVAQTGSRPPRPTPARDLLRRLIGVRQRNHDSRPAAASVPEADPSPQTPSSTGQRTCWMRYPSVSATSAGFSSSPNRSMSRGQPRIDHADHLQKAVAVRLHGFFIRGARGEIALPVFRPTVDRFRDHALDELVRAIHHPFGQVAVPGEWLRAGKRSHRPCRRRVSKGCEAASRHTEFLEQFTPCH